MSAVSQGLLLGPRLFNNFIDVLDNGTECILIKFTDDTEQGGGAGIADMLSSHSCPCNSLLKPFLLTSVFYLKFTTFLSSYRTHSFSASVSHLLHGQNHIFNLDRNVATTIY